MKPTGITKALKESHKLYAPDAEPYAAAVYSRMSKNINTIIEVLPNVGTGKTASREAAVYALIELHFNPDKEEIDLTAKDIDVTECRQLLQREMDQNPTPYIALTDPVPNADAARKGTRPSRFDVDNPDAKYAIPHKRGV